MKKSVWKKTLATGLMLATVALSSCGGGGGGGSTSTGGSTGGSTSTWGLYSNPNITAQSFIDALNDADGFVFDENQMVLDIDETFRSYEPGQEDWFVIYDATTDQNKAISLQYIQTISYYDYYANATSLADEFRNIEDDDWFNGEFDGDTFGDDYEVVDYDPYTDSFWGRNSGFEYEDEEETKDGSLLAAEKEQKAFFKKASNVSFAFNVSIETALSLVSLGNKVEGMVKKGDLTEEDQLALTGDIEKLTGASMSEMMEAASDSQKKQELLNEMAENIGTSAENLENRLLPELFGLEL